MSYTTYDYANRNIEMNVTTYPNGSTIVGSSHDPHIFGPSQWFTLHNGASAYPLDPTPFVRSGMKAFVTNVPLNIPCDNCREHFYAFIRRSNLDDVVSSRDKLFKFYVDAHNYVNSRVGLKQMSLEEARHMYGVDDLLHGARVRITYGQGRTASSS